MFGGRMVLAGAAGLMLGFAPLAAGAQSSDAEDVPAAVESFYTHLRLPGTTRALGIDGIGGRLVWSVPFLADGPSALRDRSELGIFAFYAPERSYGEALRFSTASFGLTADVRPFAPVLRQRLDPFLSFGAGFLSTDVTRLDGRAPTSLLEGSRSMLMLSPGIGTHLRLGRRLALRGDVRDAITLGSVTQHNLVVGAGIRLAR